MNTINGYIYLLLLLVSLYEDALKHGYMALNVALSFRTLTMRGIFSDHAFHGRVYSHLGIRLTYFLYITEQLLNHGPIRSLNITPFLVLVPTVHLKYLESKFPRSYVSHFIVLVVVTN
jgi:hypothetical protein